MLKAILRTWALALVAVAFSASATGRGAFSSNEPEFLDARDVFRIASIDASGGAVHVRAVVAPGYYVYRHRLNVEAGGSALPLELLLPHPARSTAPASNCAVRLIVSSCCGSDLVPTRNMRTSD